MTRLGKTLRALRRKRKLTIERVAKKAGIAAKTLSRLESDKKVGGLTIITAVCKVLGLPLSEVAEMAEGEEGE